MVRVVRNVSDRELLLIKRIAAETSRLVREEKAEIIQLAQGSPNLPLFPAAACAMIELIQGRCLPYTDVNGLIDVRQTAAAFVNRFYGRDHWNCRQKRAQQNNNNNAIISAPSSSSFPPSPSPSLSPSFFPSFSADNVILTAGAAQAVYNCLALSVNSADDVVLSPLPSYGLYKHQTGLLGGTFDAIPTSRDNRFIPTIDELRGSFAKHTRYNAEGQAIGTNVRVVVLCFPNNPTGACLSAAQASAYVSFFTEEMQRYPSDEGFSIVLDEVYLGIETNHHSLLSFCSSASPLLLSSLFLVLSGSKGLGAAPGLRAGFLCAYDTSLLAEMIKIQGGVTANASIVAQKGLQASLQWLMDHGSSDSAEGGEFERINNYYQERVGICARRLNDIGRRYLNGHVIVRDTADHATFYVLADFSSPLLPFSSDVEIQEYLRDEWKHGEDKIGVATVPLKAFDVDSSLKLLRFSVAADKEKLCQAMDIIEKAIARAVKQKKQTE